MASRRSILVADSAMEEDDPIPTYRIDLSLPPSERYVKLASDFAPRMKPITPLFDTVLESVLPWSFLRSIVKFAALLILRRVYSSEETQELVGISKASGVDMHFLVAFNLLLDILLGCTSGGVLTRIKKGKGGETHLGEKQTDTEPRARMMHFRTLDWGMPELRSVLVVLEFVRSNSKEPETVIVRTVTYAGFVGVLTGVRQDLSMSLNFRPTHNCSAVSLRMHQSLVLLGVQPSISSVLRQHLLRPEHHPPTIDNVTKSITRTRSAPCYIILCSGTETTVIQKDLISAQTKSSTDFIVHTNHDFTPTNSSSQANIQKESSSILGMETLVEESEERKDCILSKWTALAKRQQREFKRGKGRESPAVFEQTLQKWVKAYPIMNECTHFGCILDPGTGTIRWLERGVEDLEDSEIVEELM
ncbi:beta subunit of n-acylethanolamine-hydrolyzing acid amidase domain-containing protein [Trichoderma breve]|uniref:ceramidase n=1 Tax=Trichoderma breve TaxID=2034170 RepID=A0A9W9JQI5_9HYPO|nr:beta subunit of n-acylethanolamine-hydrolyzing acid amidase domain-containing protein [Trichoderma breve]KAJ4864133.1 beta subunit of n-acylethanolamine-hydrolyzing acid amidase domain-containing protein [Trichoderma breve]